MLFHLIQDQVKLFSDFLFLQIKFQIFSFDHIPKNEEQRTYKNKEI